jgi:hypothetical protein
VQEADGRTDTSVSSLKLVQARVPALPFSYIK